MLGSRIASFFRNLLHRRRVEADLDEEIRSYVHLATDERMAAGLTEDVARRAARVELGGVDQVKEHVREHRAGAWVEQWIQDARHALRLATRSPSFAIVVVLTLGIGIGATTAIFSVVDAVLLNPLPFPNANRIVTLWQHNRRTTMERDDVAPANFLDWRDRVTAFEAMATIEPSGLELLSHGEPQNLRVWRVSHGFFNILGVSPLHGRTFTLEEHQPGAGSAVVLGHGFWQRQFGADPGVVGSSITLGGGAHAIVGIMPAEFDFPPGRDLWAPRSFAEQDRLIRARTYLNVIALLRPGKSIETAKTELQRVSEQLEREYPTTNRDVEATIVPLREQIVGHVRPYLMLLTGAVALVLLITCVNVANLLLARGAARSHELAVRAALGARRQRLFSQLFIESLVLALLGGILGIVAARWGLKAMIALAPADVPRLQEAGINGSVLAFALALACATAILFGVLPARRFSRVGAEDALRAAPRGARHAAPEPTRRVLVISEVALALTLLTGASLLMRSFVNLLRVDPGFSAENVVAMPLFVWSRYPTEPQRRAFFEETIQRIQAIPGVTAAGAVSVLPFAEVLDNPDTLLTIEGRPTPPDALPTVGLSVATDGYFRAMGISLRAGRTFAGADTERSTPVAVINETMARRFWSNESPLGKRIRITSGPRVTWEIVGVVRDTRERGLDTLPRPSLFIPHRQYAVGSMTYVVRTTVDPSGIVSAVKAAVWAVNKDQPFRATTTLRQLVDASIAPRQFVLTLMGAFGAIGLFLAAVGLFGVVNYLVTQRTQEIGVRIALGAAPISIVQSFIGQGMRLAGIGAAIGLLGALGLTRLLSGLLFGVQPTDPLAFGGVVLLVFTVAGVASLLPARRAAALSPMAALRSE